MRRVLGFAAAALALLASAAAQTSEGPARRNGPVLKRTARPPGVAPKEALADMFLAIERAWIAPEYERAASLDIRARLSADLPAGRAGRGAAAVAGAAGAKSLSFDVSVDGLAAPDGRYNLKVAGGLGDVAMVHNGKRRLTVSDDFRSFSDTPVRNRRDEANLTNYRSYLLRRFNGLKTRILDSGAYRVVYDGVGSFEGREVTTLRVYRPGKIRKSKVMPLSRLWTFWADGAYEIWIYRSSKLPAAVFYTNVDDDVYANFTFAYDRQWLPTRVTFNNNSAGASGSGDLIFSYADDRTVKGVSLRYSGDNGVYLNLDASLLLRGAPGPGAFRAIPPFGFRKLNRDHLKVMLLTQISGGLLKLKKHGFSLKNFKF